jgi:sulfatase modifying factor 1
MAVVLATACVIFVLVVIIVLSRGTAPKPGVDATPGDGEFAAFHMAESLDTHESWSAFLKNYSKGELASIARERGQQLETREQKAQKAKAAEHQAGATTPKTQVPTAVAATPPPVTKPADLTPRPKLADTVLMSGGVFMMGTDSGKGDEKPLHQVGLDAFRMSPSPITNSQYFPFLEDTGHQRPKDPAFAKNYLLGYPDLPVVNVSFDEANAFCKWASNKFGVAVRLPTEAEWEFANRGRLNGNVWEWVSDFYSKDYYSTSPVKNPDGPTNGSKRVIRGGSWTKADAELANHRRASRDPKERSDQIGFRIVVDARIKR